MIDLLNDPRIRAELTNGAVLVFGLAVAVGVAGMARSLLAFLNRGDER